MTNPFRECECCGQALPWGAEVEGDLVKMTPLEEAIFRVVRRAGLEGIPSDVLVERVYTGRDGGPITARAAVRVHVWKLNQKLRSKNFKVRSHKGGNHVPGRYYLMALGDEWFQ